MKVLVACEESQEVCKAFRALGHEAYSCDIQEPSGGHPEWHILGDALKVINGGIITTMDGVKHDIGKWDLLIAHRGEPMAQSSATGCECYETVKSIAAASLIEQMNAESVVLPDGQVSAIESLLKEIEWKDMVISLAQRKQADAEADRDALLGKWISVDEKLPELGTRVIATDGVFVGEAIFARDSRWSGYGGGILRDCIGSVVTHWMPLPGAPEEGERHE